ncbi:uncharacterized protein LOC110979934 [Acanthaster planci]|uniref:Uncharacterized protein LOC110979934 n=1 Tax=Acanthaster planci TaxID=133434 RepID=A0A8B7YGU9_ACAPL|nr:uncharacterized protein LOC110979934 [Acanthaster planci]
MSELRDREGRGNRNSGGGGSSNVTPSRSEVMEKTLGELRGKVTEVTDESFNKAWDRVYGNKEYRPSWVGKITDGGRQRGGRGLPPPKPLYVPGAGIRPEPAAAQGSTGPAHDKALRKIEEEPPPKPRLKPQKSHEEIKSKQYAGIPEQFRAKHVPSPLKIGGKVVPQEQELDTWKDAIASDEVSGDGKPVYNKVVKQTNITGWMDNNNYWEPKTTSLTSNLPPPPRRRHKPRIQNHIVTANYDMVGKYENKVRRQDLKIGAQELPAEKELKTWGEDLEIPDDLGATDYSQEDAKVLETAGSSPRRQKWNAVLKHSNVPGFFTHNNYWK